MRAGAFTPQAMFADNDLAMAQLIEAVSRSRFWETAIFVLEDDAQAGPDHVDFDAPARPMYTAFTSEADFRPFAAVEPKQSRTERNPGGTPEAVRSAKLDLSEADLIDDQELNDILWRGIKGEPAPPPRRSIFYPGVLNEGGDEH
jgi:hypothetical protein